MKSAKDTENEADVLRGCFVAGSGLAWSPGAAREPQMILVKRPFRDYNYPIRNAEPEFAVRVSRTY